MEKTKSENIVLTPEQFGRMFRECRKLVLIDKDADEWNEALDDSYTVENPLSVGREIASDPSRWGVVVSRLSRNHAGAFYDARQLFAFGIVPPHIDRLVCISSEEYSENKAERLREAGFTVVYDGSGKTSYATPSDGLVIQHPLYCDGLLYTAPVPQDIEEALEYHEDDELYQSIQQVVAMSFGSSFCELNDFDLSLAVETFTYGHKKLVSNKDREISIARWRRYALDPECFEQYPHKNREGLVSPEEFENILGFWHKRLEEAGLELRVSCLRKEALSSLGEIGKTLGVNHDIEAYFAGVPVEDILAE